MVSGLAVSHFLLFFLKQAPLRSAALADTRKAPRSALLLSKSHALDAMTTNVFIAEVHLPKKTSKQNTKSLVKGEMSSLHSLKKCCTVDFKESHLVIFVTVSYIKLFFTM